MNIHRLPTALAIGGLLSMALLVPSHVLNAQGESAVIDIYVPEKVVHKIALPTFEMGSGPPELPQQVTDQIGDDLEFTGLFKVINRGAYLEKPGAVPFTGAGTNWEDWKVLKASIIGRGQIEVRGNDVTIRVRAFHVDGQRTIGAKTITGRSEQMDAVVHQAAEALYELLTGETAYFTSQIAYINNRTGHKEVYVASFDGSNERAITRNRSINLSPAWSSDGAKIAFTSYVRGNPDLFMYDGNSGKFYRLSNRRGLNIGAAFSPRGRVLAATLSIKRGNPDVYLINEDGTGPRRITTSYANDVSPTWSPDAREIAFVSDRAGGPNIYKVSSSGGTPKRLTFKFKDNQSPDWSPRGDRIVFASRIKGRWEIFTMTPDGDDLRQLTAGPGNSEDPVWSPDGRMILFSNDRGGRKHLWVMEADGSNPRKLTSGSGDYSNPSWGRAGSTS